MRARREASSAGLRCSELHWSELHHGIDPAEVPLLGRWLRLMWLLARPLVVARVPPNAISLLGALCAVGAFVAGHPVLSLAGVFVAVLCDGLDGAVALLADRASRAGARVDAIADRIADVAFAGILWRFGAPWWLALLAAIAAVVLELTRMLRGGEVLARITVAERPSRVVCTVLALLSATVSVQSWPQALCASILLGLCVIGIAQLAAP